MVTPYGKYIFVKQYRESDSKIVLPDNVQSHDSVVFEVLATGPDVTEIKVGDVVAMKQQAIAQQIQGGFVCHSDLVCAKVT